MARTTRIGCPMTFCRICVCNTCSAVRETTPTPAAHSARLELEFGAALESRTRTRTDKTRAHYYKTLDDRSAPSSARESSFTGSAFETSLKSSSRAALTSRSRFSKSAGFNKSGSSAGGFSSVAALKAL